MIRGAAVAAALAIVVVAQPGFAQQGDDVKSLRKEVDALKEGQKAIQNDIQELKNLIRSRPAAAPPSLEATVTVKGAPFKGSQTAKVTLVEFTDYQ